MSLQENAKKWLRNLVNEAAEQADPELTEGASLHRYGILLERLDSMRRDSSTPFQEEVVALWDRSMDHALAGLTSFPHEP